MQALCSKLKTHWTNIAHHLYLKAEAPVPLPAVGPLAELLNVTRGVCLEINTLAAAGNLTAVDISIALETSTVRLLGRLVQWLQAEPHEQLLLNSERSESLWQLLLLTLANMLKVLQPENEVAVDAELISRFKQQLQSSGLLGKAQDTNSSDGSSNSPSAEAPPSGLLAALQWLLQHHPHRSLTASMGAWLLLTELGATSGKPQHAGSTSTAAVAADAADVGVGPEQPFALADTLLPALATVLQAYVDCGYANAARLPTAPISQVPVCTGSGRNSGTGTPAVRRLGSRERLESSSSPAATAPLKKRGNTVAVAQEGSPGGHAPAEADAGAVLKGTTHAVCLTDDPSTAVFNHLLACLQSLQIQLLVLAANMSVDSKEQQQDAKAQVQDSRPSLPLPHATNMQVLAAANTYMQQCAGAAAEAAPGRQYEHQTMLPLPAIAVEALAEVRMDSLAAAQQLVELCSKALQRDCIQHLVLMRKQQQQQQQEQNAGGEGSSSSNNAASASSSIGGSDSKADPAAVYRLLLDSVSLQQACGVAVTEDCLGGLSMAAHACTRAEVQQLLQQRGAELLRVLLRYIQHDPMQQHLQQVLDVEGSCSADGEAAEAVAGAGQQERDYFMPKRCVACAQVFMEVCSMGRRGVDENLLGCLTETDPATFYTIMDLLVRKVHPDSLMVLLPMSACFLHHDMTVTRALREEQRQRKQQQQQQQGTDADPTASEQQEQQNTSSSASTSTSTSSSEAQELIAVSRSLVILHDPDVCRTFAAALHGYCKTALAQLDELAAGGHECSGHSCGHDHEHGHEHHHNHHERSVASTLPPLQHVVSWLLFSFDVTMAAVEDDSAIQELKAADTAAAAADVAGGDSSSGDRLLLSVDKQALQLQVASQAAAGSLVLTILLARAAAPVLNWMQTQLKQLQAAAAEGDVLLPVSTAGEVYAGLHFVHAVWQAICSRYALSMLLEEQLKQLLKAAAAAVTASKALGDKVAKTRGAAASEQETAAAAEAERVSKGLRVAASATHAALHGRGLAKGWSHLAYVLPQEALIAARDFQTTWPGNLMLQCKAVALIEAAQAKQHQQQHEGGSSSSSSATDVHLPVPVHQELLRLVKDAQQMFTTVMDEIPLPVGCNNPGCNRLEAVAEATLSINKRCSQCLAAHYCCKECQVQHWPAHKTACKRLRQPASGKPVLA